MVAQKHALAPSTLARRLSQLEDEAGGRLFLRTHTGLKLTPLGVRAYNEAARVIEDLTIVQCLSPASEARSIDLFIDVRLSTEHALRGISSYCRRHNQTVVRVRRQINSPTTRSLPSNEFIELTAKSTLAPSEGIVRYLAASPQYVPPSLLPVLPGDLNSLRLIGIEGDDAELVFGEGRDMQLTRIAPSLVMPDYDTLFSAVLRGLGIGLVHDSENTQRLFADGSLTRVLPDWRGSTLQHRCGGTLPILVQLLQSTLDSQHSRKPAFAQTHAA